MRGRQRVRRKNVFKGGLGFAGVAGVDSLKGRADGVGSVESSNALGGRAAQCQRRAQARRWKRGVDKGLLPTSPSRRRKTFPLTYSYKNHICRGDFDAVDRMCERSG